MGIIELVIFAVIVSGLTWVCTTMFGGHRSEGGALTMSPEVKEYIDSKFAGGADSCADLPKLVSKVADLEVKMGEVGWIKESYRLMGERRDQLEAAALRARDTSVQLVTQIRANEVRRIKDSIDSICGGGGGGGRSTSSTMLNNLKVPADAQPADDK